VKLVYNEMEYRCRNCGRFIVSEQNHVRDDMDCPKCNRSSEFVQGIVIRVVDEKPKSIAKSQKRLIEA